jgi:hypothetical protein
VLRGPDRALSAIGALTESWGGDDDMRMGARGGAKVLQAFPFFAVHFG